MRKAVTIAVLAGGKSSRFGGIDKQEIIFNGEKLGRIAAGNALSSGYPVVVIGQNRSPYQGLPLRFVEDVRPGFGPLSGLHAALSGIAEGWLYLTACDMPYFSLEWLDYLVSSADEAEKEGFEVLAAQSGAHLEPFHALYSAALKPRLENSFAEGAPPRRRASLSRLIREGPYRAVPESVVRFFSPDWRLFRGINNPAELEALKGRR